MKIFILPHVLSFTIRISSKKLFFWIFAPKVYGYLKVADTFIETFEASVDSHSSSPNIEKFTYSKGYVVGKAAQISLEGE